MKAYTVQELESVGFLSKLFGSKPTENAWKELNNLLAAAPNAASVSKEDAVKALKKWGVKYNEGNVGERSGLYRKLADEVYTEAMNEDDALFAETAHLAEVLELPENLVKLANKGAKTSAYFARCKKLLSGEEKLDIHSINKLFGYDYEDGLSVRKQVFAAHFNMIFEEIQKAQRFSPDEEAALRKDCETLDIPYEFKNNITNALGKFRDLWAAENQPLGQIDLDIPLNKGEVCHASVNCGLCENKVVEREDNLLELTRKFEIDETVNFKGEKLEHPKIKEEITALLELGHFVLTNQRIIYLSQKTAWGVLLKNISSAEFDDINMVTFHTTTEKGDVLIKFPDEAAGVMFILFNRAKEAAK